MRYAELLAKKMTQHATNAWLINTGWSGGGYGVGERMKLAHTRAIIDAIHSGELAQTPTVRDDIFGLAMPTACHGVPSEVLHPRRTWASEPAYHEAAQTLAQLFHQNFSIYASEASDAVKAAGPCISDTAAA
jgi:phosphoenolpyruvate carboxykinase (ATP)